MIHRRFPAVALIVTGTLIASVPALAKDIFVGTSGDDARSGSSSSQALRTFAAAVAKASPGDTVHILPGRYEQSLEPTRSGTAAAPITFRSHGPGPAVLTHSRKNGLKPAILVKGVSYIVIDGIHVDGVKRGPDAHVKNFADIVDSTHITLRRGNFNYANGWHGIKVDGASSFVTIEDNVIDNVGTYDTGKGANSDFGDSIVVTKEASKVLIQRNILRHGAHNLIATKGRNHVVQDNILDNSYRDQLGGNAGGRCGQILSSDSVFQRNYVTGSGKSSDADYNALLKIEGVRNIARNNVFAYGQQEGIISESGKWSRNTVEGRIYNNTFYKIGACAWCVRHYKGGEAIGDFVFMNNLVIDSRQDPRSREYDSDVLLVVKSAAAGPTARSKVMGNIFRPASDKTPTVALAGFDGVISLDKSESTYSDLFSRNLGQSRNRGARVQLAKATLAAVEDFDLKPGSPGIDQGMFLTTAVESGQSDRLKVADPRFFSDGYGLVPGDLIQLEGSSERVRVEHVDLASGTLVLASPIRFKAGQGVALAYDGAAPDVGAREWTGDKGVSPAKPGRTASGR